MYKQRRITPKCPKCNGNNTYDIIPELPNIPEIQYNQIWDFYGHGEFYDQIKSFNINNLHLYNTIGNSKYYCMDCNRSWKKYRGRKPYEKIKSISANVGGYPGPYFNVKINLENRQVDYHKFMSVDDETSIVNEDCIAWLLEELYKCDFINWAEEYIQPMVLDGTHWSVQIEYDSHCEIKTGDNYFPPKWTKFCKAISELTGNEFY